MLSNNLWAISQQPRVDGILLLGLLILLLRLFLFIFLPSNNNICNQHYISSERGQGTSKRSVTCDKGISRLENRRFTK